jgi:hypothetical protein
MPFFIILERIFMLFIGGFLIALWKLFRSVFSAIEQSAERKSQQHESEKAFGRLNQDIEIYDPSKPTQQIAQQTTQPPPRKPLASPQQKPKARP